MESPPGPCSSPPGPRPVPPPRKGSMERRPLSPLRRGAEHLGAGDAASDISAGASIPGAPERATVTQRVLIVMQSQTGSSPGPSAAENPPITSWGTERPPPQPRPPVTPVLDQGKPLAPDTQTTGSGKSYPGPPLIPSTLNHAAPRGATSGIVQSWALPLPHSVQVVDIGHIGRDPEADPSGHSSGPPPNGTWAQDCTSAPSQHGEGTQILQDQGRQVDLLSQDVCENDTMMTDGASQSIAPLHPQNIRPEDVKSFPAVRPEDVKSAPAVRPEDMKSAPSIRPEDVKSAPAVRPEDMKSTPAVRPEDVKSAPSVEPEDMKSAPSIRPEDVKSAPSIRPEDVKSAPSIRPEDVKSAPSIKPEDVKSAPSIKPEDVKSAPSIRPEDVKSAPAVRPEDVKSAPAVRPEDVKSAPAVRPEDVKSAPAVRPEDVKSAPAVRPEDVKSAPAVRPEDVKSAPAVRPEDVKSAPAVRPEDVKSAPAVRPEDVKSAPAVRPEDVKSAPAVRPEDVKSAPAVRPEDVKSAPAVRLEDVKSAPAVRPEDVKSAPAVRPEDVKSAPAVRPEDVKSVPAVRPIDVKSAPAVRPIDVKSAPAVRPIDVKSAPAVRPEDVKSAPSIKPEDMKSAPSIKPEDVKSAPSIRLEDVKSAPAVRPEDVKSAPAVRPEDVKSAPAVRPEDVKSAPAVRPEDVKSAPAVRPEDVKSAPAVRPEDVKSAPAIKPEDMKSAPSIKPEDVKSAPAVRPEDVKSALVIGLEDVKSFQAVRPEDVKSAATVGSEDMKSALAMRSEDVKSIQAIRSEDVRSAAVVRLENVPSTPTMIPEVTQSTPHMQNTVVGDITPTPVNPTSQSQTSSLPAQLSLGWSSVSPVRVPDPVSPHRNMSSKPPLPIPPRSSLYPGHPSREQETSVSHESVSLSSFKSKAPAPDTLSYLDSVSLMSGTMESLTLLDDASSIGSDSEINGMPYRKTDKYGFLGGNQYRGNGDASIPVEIARQRELKWLEMFSNWDKWLTRRFQKVKLRCRKGIPSSLRAKAWQFLSNSHDLLMKNPGKFEEMERQQGDPKWLDVIEKDLHRQFPFHEMFAARGGHGQQDLYRILKAYTVYRPEEGYCQAQAPVAAVLLMHMPAEQAFWCLVQICDKYLPGYYSAGLEAIQLDGEIFFALLRRVCPMAYRHLKKFKIDPILYMTEWFMCIFSRTLPWASVLRVWDMFFCEGVKIVFRVGLVLLRHTLGSVDKLRSCQGMYETMEKLRSLPVHCMQEDVLLPEVSSLPVTDALIERESNTQLRKWRENRGELQYRPSRRLHGARQIYEEKLRLNPTLSGSRLSLSSIRRPSPPPTPALAVQPESVVVSEGLHPALPSPTSNKAPLGLPKEVSKKGKEKQKEQERKKEKEEREREKKREKEEREERRREKEREKQKEKEEKRVQKEREKTDTRQKRERKFSFRRRESSASDSPRNSGPGVTDSSAAHDTYF